MLNLYSAGSVYFIQASGGVLEIPPCGLVLRVESTLTEKCQYMRDVPVFEERIDGLILHNALDLQEGNRLAGKRFGTYLLLDLVLGNEKTILLVSQSVAEAAARMEHPLWLNMIWPVLPGRSGSDEFGRYTNGFKGTQRVPR